VRVLLALAVLLAACGGSAPAPSPEGCPSATPPTSDNPQGLGTCPGAEVCGVRQVTSADGTQFSVASRGCGMPCDIVQTLTGATEPLVCAGAEKCAPSPLGAKTWVCEEL
jgi:hypothetical protein